MPLSVALTDPALQRLDFSDPRLFALGRCIAMPLARALPDGKLVPGLASNWSTPDDGRTWTFELRPVADADDPAYLGQHLIRHFTQLVRGPESSLRAQIVNLVDGAADLANGKGMEISGMSVSGAALQIKLTRPSLVFPQWVSQPALGVLVNDDLKQLPVGGFGPFGIDHIDGNTLVLKPNPDSLDSAPLLTQLDFVCEPDLSKQLTLFREGKLDASNVALADVAAVREDATLKASLVEQQTAAMYLGVHNWSRFPWGDQQFQTKVGLRSALNQALDMTLLNQAISGQFQVWRHFVAPAFKSYIPAELLQAPVFGEASELEKAKANLKDADHEQGSHLNQGMDLGYRTGIIDPKLDIEILRYWNDISLKMRPFPLTEDEWNMRVGNRAHEILLLKYCPAYADVDAALYPLLHGSLAGKGGNVLWLKEDAIDKALEDGQAAGDSVARQKIYQALTRELEERSMAVFIGNSTPTLLVSPKVAGIKLGPYDFDASLPAQDWINVGTSP
jgi:ABC-type oligopeptide transport system substrate-binding subunit